MKIKSKTIHLKVLALAMVLAFPSGGHLMAQIPKLPFDLSARVYAGPSWCVGSGFENIGSSGLNVTQPEAGLILRLNFEERYRAGIDVGYTTMVREQFNGDLQPITGQGVVGGSVEGTLYRDFKTRYCIVGATGEMAVLKPGGFLQLFAGTGVGCLFANGNTWSLSMRNEMRTDTLSSLVSINGHNERHNYAAIYVPASLSLEINIFPQTKVCVGGIFRFVFSSVEIAPKGQACANLGLQLEF